MPSPRSSASRPVIASPRSHTPDFAKASKIDWTICSRGCLPSSCMHGSPNGGARILDPLPGYFTSSSFARAPYEPTRGRLRHRLQSAPRGRDRGPTRCVRSSAKVECVAANEEGQDLRTAGRIVAATKLFAMCSSRSCLVPVRADCVERAQEAARSQPTVRFVVTNGRGTDIRNVRLRIDDSTAASKLGDAAIAVDPGKHRFEFDAGRAGKATKTFEIAVGHKDREEIVLVEPPAGAVMPEQEDDLILGLPHRTVAYLTGGTGALLLVGGVAGLMANSKYDEAVRSCDAAVNGQRGCRPALIRATRTSCARATLAMTRRGRFASAFGYDSS